MRTLEGHSESEILNMIWNRAPFFMRVGGNLNGGFEGDGPSPVPYEAKQEFAALLAKGRTLRQIADDTGYSYNSVVKHTRHLRRDAR